MELTQIARSLVGIPSVEALDAYRKGVAHPDWHRELITRPAAGK
jgi:hypothetical protein